MPAGITTTVPGVPTGPASLQLFYQPKYGGWKAASYAMSGLLAGSTAASWGTSFIISAMRPTSTAGGVFWCFWRFCCCPVPLCLRGVGRQDMHAIPLGGGPHGRGWGAPALLLCLARQPFTFLPHTSTCLMYDKLHLLAWSKSMS